MLDLIVTLRAALVGVVVTLLPRGYLVRARRLPPRDRGPADRERRD